MADAALKDLQAKQEAKARAAEERQRMARAKDQADALGRILGKRGPS